MSTPQGHRYSTDLGGRELVIETGKYAKQVAGSVTLRYGDTMVLVTAQMNDAASRLSFLPLTVEYEERHYAIGKIPGSFLRREGRPAVQATLNARITDRQIRPLFPKSLRNEIQVIITILSADQINDPGPLAAIGASAALALSDIPWDGPTACAKVGYVAGNYVINPTLQQLDDGSSELDLTVAVTEDAVLMVEAAANELSEEQLVGAISFAQEQLAPVIALIERMRAELGLESKSFEPAGSVADEDIAAMAAATDSSELRTALLTTGKHERSQAIKAVRDGVIETLVPDAEAEGAGDQISVFKEAFRKVGQGELRNMVLSENIRTDGRPPDRVRPIWIEVGVLPRAHGSAVFTRGETQVLAVATLGTGRDNRLVDDLGLDDTEEFMLHYNFPPYSTGEVKRLRGTSRREQGHGNLARRALLGQIPDKETFPYVLRVVGETLESNGSSSMATVCATSLALMDAGVPTDKSVAGIAMGLVKEGDDYRILSDILGSEDALGDMDFKVAGTRDGITALQMDIKIGGITAAIMREALEQARAGRHHILDQMDAVLPRPRSEVSPLAPRIYTVRIPVGKIGAVIGPGGKQIRELEALGTKIEIEEDGLVKVYSEESDAADQVVTLIEQLTAEAEVGKIYDGVVVKTVDFGAFVALFPGTDGLLHISQIAEGRVERVQDHLNEGDKLQVKVNSIDDQGKIDLVRPELEGIVMPRRAGRGGRGGGGRGGRPDGNRRGPPRDRNR